MPRQYGEHSVIAFYSRDGECPWMANTARGLPVKDKNGKEWKTTEAWFQAQKFDGDDDNSKKYREAIRNYDGKYSEFPPYARKMQAKYHLNFDSAAWDARSADVMREAIDMKLNQHPQVKIDLMMLPETVIIVEATHNDSRWGDGNNHEGLNMLGRIWMEKLAIAHGKSPTEAKQIADEKDNALKAYRAQPENAYKSLYFLSGEATQQIIQSLKDQMQTLEGELNEKKGTPLKSVKYSALKVLHDALSERKADGSIGEIQSASAIMDAVRQLEDPRFEDAKKGIFSHRTNDLIKEVKELLKEHIRLPKEAPALRGTIQLQS